MTDRPWREKEEQREPGKWLGMMEKWEERGRTNLRTDQGKHVYTGRGHAISRLVETTKQDRGKMDRRAK